MKIPINQGFSWGDNPDFEKLRFFEFKAMFGGNLVCGFGRLFGQLTGFLINSGPITAGDSQKGGHFVQVRTHVQEVDVFIQSTIKTFLRILLKQNTALLSYVC